MRSGPVRDARPAALAARCRFGQGGQQVAPDFTQTLPRPRPRRDPDRWRPQSGSADLPPKPPPPMEGAGVGGSPTDPPALARLCADGSVWSRERVIEPDTPRLRQGLVQLARAPWRRGCCAARDEARVACSSKCSVGRLWGAMARAVVDGYGAPVISSTASNEGNSMSEFSETGISASNSPLAASRRDAPLCTRPARDRTRGRRDVGRGAAGFRVGRQRSGSPLIRIAEGLTE